MSEVSNPINEKNKQIKTKKKTKVKKIKLKQQQQKKSNSSPPDQINNRRYSKCSHQFFNIVHEVCFSD